MPDPFKVAAIPWSQIRRILYGLAYARTLALKCSEVTEHYDNIFYVPGLQQLQPSSLSLGDNVSGNPQLFERMVKEELSNVAHMFHSFLSRNKTNHQAIVDWINGANKARREYAQTYQQKLDDVNKTTAQMGKALFFSMATAACVECASEVALTCVGLGGGTKLGEMTISFAARRITFSAATNLAPMTVGLATKKAVIGITDGVIVSFCDSWTKAGGADMLGAVKDNTQSNLPGWVSDVLDPYLAAFNEWVIDSARQAAQAHGAANSYNAARTADLERRAVGALGGAAQKGSTYVGNAATGAATFFAIVSIYGSYSKLADRLNAR
jgi:hypothetical protein